MKTENVQQHFTVPDVANLLKVSPSYIYHLIDMGRLPALQFPVMCKNGRRANRRILRITANDLHNFLSNLPKTI